MKAYDGYHEIYRILAQCYKKIGRQNKYEEFNAELKKMYENCHGKNSRELLDLEESDEEVENIRQSPLNIKEDEEEIRMSMETFDKPDESDL